MKYTKLGNLVELIMGQAPPSKECNFEGQGTPFVKAGEFGKTRPVIREWTTKPLRLASRDDVLLCVVGATCGKINLGEDCAIGRSVAAIRPDTEQLNQYFLHYFMMTLIDHLRSGSLGAAQTVISKNMIKSVRIPCLSLPEQRRIVGILDEAFDGIATAKANAEKNLQNARALFESYLNSIFKKGGDDWAENSVKEMCVIGDGNHSGKYPKKSEMVPAGIPFIRGTNLINGQISAENILFISPEKHSELKKGHLQTGDVLFTNRGEIGKVAMVDEAFNGANLNSQIAWLRCKDKLLPNYLFYFLQSSKMKRHFEQTKSGAALQQFTIRMLSAVQITYPKLAEQRKLIQRFKELQSSTRQLEWIYQRKLAALDELKKSLLHQAFSGQL